MKNSVGCFEAAWLFIWNLIKNSFIYKFIKGIYDKISNSWKNSRIAGWFRKTHVEPEALGKTLAGRVVKSPFTFIEFLQKKLSEPLSRAIENSFFLNLCRTYLHNLLALNLRFIGAFILCGTVGLSISRLISHSHIGYLVIAMSVIGAILLFINKNLIDMFKDSKVVAIILNILGTESDFDFYNKEYTTGRARLILAAVAGLVFGYLGGEFNPLLAVVGAIGIAVFFLIMERPSAGVFFLLLAAPIVPTMADVFLACLCLFSLLVYAITHKGFKFKFDGIGFFLIIFIAIYLVAGFTSFSLRKSMSIFLIYFIFISMYFVIINTVNSKKTLNTMLTVFVISGCLVCLYGIMQYVFGWDTNQAWMDEQMFEDIRMRIYSTLDNPNVLGEYILLVLPVSVGLMWTKKGAPAKIFYAAISALMAGALILTFSRGCWVGIIIAAAIFITFAAGKLWGLGLIALPIIPMVLPKSIINRFTSIGNMEDSSTSYRVYIWMGTLALLKDFWATGIGMGQEAFTQVYPFYSYNGIVAPHSHNLFLQITVESSFIGIIVFAIIMILFLRRTTIAYQIGGKGAPLSTMMTAIAAGICGFLVQGMFDNCFYNYRVMLVFWCVIALGRACAYVARIGCEDKV